MKLAALAVVVGASLAGACEAGEDALCLALRDYANDVSLSMPKAVTVKAGPALSCVHLKDERTAEFCRRLREILSVDSMLTNVRRVRQCMGPDRHLMLPLDAPEGSVTTRVPAFSRRGLVFTLDYSTAANRGFLPFMTLSFEENRRGALDYDQMVMLDAEDLAEGGIARAYSHLSPQLRRYVPSPEAIEEVVNPDAPSYAIRFRKNLFQIYGPGRRADSWNLATYVFFKLVNDQLGNAPVRFYAINGGNDLGGMFLTKPQVDEARENSHEEDWPYLPNDEPPWHGRPHRTPAP
jgi:hypothetical protein